MAFQIARRAYGILTKVEDFDGSWTDAMNHAMAIEAANRDGEYLVFFPGQPLKTEAAPYGQSSFDWL